MKALIFGLLLSSTSPWCLHPVFSHQLSSCTLFHFHFCGLRSFCLHHNNPTIFYCCCPTGTKSCENNLQDKNKSVNPRWSCVIRWHNFILAAPSSASFYQHIHCPLLDTRPTHLSLASLALSPKPLTCAVPLMDSFLSLSILIIPKENLNIFICHLQLCVLIFLLFHLL